MLNLAAPAARRGDFEGALALAEEALALGAAPSRRRALLRRARCLAALGRRGGAGDALWDLLLDEPPHSKGETPTEAEVIGELAEKLTQEIENMTMREVEGEMDQDGNPIEEDAFEANRTDPFLQAQDVDFEMDRNLYRKTFAQ